MLRVSSRFAGGDGAIPALVLPTALLLVAAAGWWWSVRMAADMGAMGDMGGMTMSLGAFVVAWAAMMAAMMLPAIMPVAKLYARAADRGRAAPIPFFVSGYLVLWTVFALPGYVAWRALETPIATGEPWTGRLAGATMVAAAVWQLTPLKSRCLRHCRSPLGFFMRFGGRIERPAGALRMGAAHGVYCLGCCWALFAVLVALGTMDLLWMVLLTALIILEKNTPRGELIAVAGGAALALLGVLLVAEPSILFHLT